MFGIRLVKKHDNHSLLKVHVRTQADTVSLMNSLPMITTFRIDESVEKFVLVVGVMLYVLLRIHVKTKKNVLQYSKVKKKTEQEEKKQPSICHFIFCSSR